MRVSMAPKCKWCGEAQAHRKSALARIALAFVNGKSDLESSKYQVARVWEGRDGSSSYKELGPVQDVYFELGHLGRESCSRGAEGRGFSIVYH